MTSSATVFHQTSQEYLTRLSKIPYLDRANFLGADVEGSSLCIEMYGRPYWISAEGVFNQRREVCSFSKQVVLLNYILRCPEALPRKGRWIAWREVPGSGPLAVYMGANAVKPIECTFSGDVKKLQEASRLLGGKEDSQDRSSDFSATFKLLPRISLHLKFNDGDEEFPASCTLLFTEDVSLWLDTESLAILTVLFVATLCGKGDPAHP